MAMVTAGALLALLQRHGARLVAGAAGLERPITWAITARASPPAFGEVRGGELALLALGTIAALHAQDDALTLARLEQDLSRRGVAAIAVAGLLGDDTLSGDASAPSSSAGNATNRTALLGGAVTADPRTPTMEEVRLAEALGLPLVGLPAGAPLADIEREVIAAVVAPAPPTAADTSRGIYDALVQDSLRGDDDQALGHHLAALAHAAVVLGDDHAIRWCAVPSGFPLAQEALLNLLRRPSSRAEMREILNGHRPTPPSPIPARQEGAPSDTTARAFAAGYRWWCIPLRPHEGTAVLLALVAPHPETRGGAGGQTDGGGALEAIDYGAILDQVAPLFTLSLARQRDFASVERRLRAETLDALLAGTYPDEARMRERATQLGHNLAHPHVALLIVRESGAVPPGGKVPSDSPPLHGEGMGERSGALVDALTAGAEGAWARERDAEVVVLVPVATDATPGDLAGLAARLTALVAREPGRWFAGMSEPAVGPAEMRRAAGEARDTARLGRLVLGPAHVARAADLGIYRLLLRLRETGELEDFCRHALGPLLAEPRHSAALLATLDAFFACNGNLSEAARRLDMHRNSLIYRVNRIRELLGHDLEDPELRLTLQLALKARQVLALGEAE